VKVGRGNANNREGMFVEVDIFADDLGIAGEALAPVGIA